MDTCGEGTCERKDAYEHPKCPKDYTEMRILMQSESGASCERNGKCCRCRRCGRCGKLLLTLQVYGCTIVHMSPQYTRGFRQLIAWKEAHQLALMIYRTTANFPAEERFGITSQIRRAACSTAAQIAEGSHMETLRHRNLYYERAYASLAEVDSFLELCLDLHFIEQPEHEKLQYQLNKTASLLRKLSGACRTPRQQYPAAPPAPSAPS